MDLSVASFQEIADELGRRHPDVLILVRHQIEGRPGVLGTRMHKQTQGVDMQALYGMAHSAVDVLRFLIEATTMPAGPSLDGPQKPPTPPNPYQG